jgi:hypothetical protein
MKTTTLMLRVVKTVFPSFEFTWLGEEMEQNLPLEMDFRASRLAPYCSLSLFADGALGPFSRSRSRQRRSLRR